MSLPLHREIDKVCDEFEQNWSPQSRLQLDNYLSRFASPDRGQLFAELMRVDIDCCSRKGVATSPEEYLRHYPDFAEQIRSITFREGLTGAGTASADHENRPQPGKRIAQYVLTERVGAGAEGEVWQARDTQLQRIVAMKLPHTAAMTDQGLRRFLREGRTVAQLSHPGIVKIYDAGRDGSNAYIASQFIEGPCLDEWRQRRAPTPMETATIVRAVAEALHHAHEKGVVHRDLKPQNIIIDAESQPHITDFGLAQWSDATHRSTMRGEIVGTYAYMSPEQARGESAKVDNRCDIYSLGVMLYELLTARRPFDGDGREILRQILMCDPKSPRSINPAIPRELEAICLKGMHKLPERRYGTARKMAEDLRRFIEGEPVSARPIHPTSALLRRLKPYRVIAVAGAATFIAVASFLFARTTAREIQELRGAQTVSLVTDPPGAKAVIVPINPTTGEPITKAAFRAKGKTPLKVNIDAGEYLVIVMLDNGSFHEVHRRVPQSLSDLPGMYSHASWIVEEDETVRWPRVKIPSALVTAGMALIKTDGVSGSVKLREFYLDCTEATVEDFLGVVGLQGRDSKRPLPPPDWAINTSHDQALWIAEQLGKRLPTEQEFERACSFREQSSTEPATPPSSFGPVGAAGEDKTTTHPVIFGLCSNMAEWTMSRPALFLDGKSSGSPEFLPQDYRIVRGGSDRVIKADFPLSSDDYSVECRTVVMRFATRAGVGFRCARSVLPTCHELLKN